MRFFIALEIPESSREEIELVQKQIKDVIPQIKLTDPQKLHLTVAFIGEEPDSLTEDLTDILRKSAQGIAPFFITPAYIDGFPSLHHARTMWVGIKGDIDRLMVLRERVKDGLVDLHLEVDERRYVPHIAIGKIDNFHINSDQEKQLEDIMNKQFHPIQIVSLKLFESIPQEGFHQHNTLADIHLS